MQQTISLNDVLPMKVRLKLDGEEIYYGKGNSFLKNFLLHLHSFASGDAIQDDIYTVIDNTTTVLANQSFTNTAHLVTTVAISSGKLRLTTSSSHGLSTGQYAYVMGVNGITGGNYLGYQQVTVISTTIIELTNTSGLSGSHNNAVSVPYIRDARLTVSSTGSVRSDGTTFGPARIAVGKGTTANSVTTQSLEDEIVTGSGQTAAGSLALSSLTIFEPSIGGTTSAIEITQDFTNNGGVNLSVNEIGLWTRVETDTNNHGRYATIIRDVLPSTVTVNVGQTLSVTYELTTDVPSTSGGILIQFNEVLYRQLGQISREAKDIFNANSVKNAVTGQFYMNGNGGLNPIGNTELGATSLSAYYIGPRAGSSTDSVVNTNFRLQDSVGNNTAFEHGTGSNELYHYGSYVTPIEVDGDDIFFQVWRLVQNLSGSTITVNEMGLYFGYVAGNNLEAVHCMARHLISPAVDILNNDYAKLIYEIRITV
jgi:hypothetical protein